MRTLKKILLTSPLALVASLAAAETKPDDAGKEELLAILAEQTELATKTRLNVDYVPGILDVLRGEELANRGARTVWDALGFVPGINPVIDQLGHPRIVVRGLGTIGETWYSGYVKLLLNGVPLNTDDRGFADPVFFLPVAQVDRIEVIRGPGSAVHGEYAIAGVVNIITRRDETSVFGFAGSSSEHGGGAILDARQGDLRFSLNLGAWKTDGANVMTGPDAPYQFGAGQYSYAPGRTHETTRAGNAIAHLDYRNLSVIAQWTQSELGDFFGVNYALPPPGNGPVEKAAIRQVEGRYKFDALGGNIDLYAGSRNYRLKKNQLFSSSSGYLGIPGSPDVRVDSDYEETRTYFGSDLAWGFDAHKLLLAVYSARTTVDHASMGSNMGFDGSGLVITPTPVPYPYPIKEGTTRDLFSVSLQDEYRASDVFSLTTGARYDKYSNVDASLAPRVAGVWRFGEQEVIKAQYGRAFRPPTLSETAGTNNLKPTTVDTAEIGYIRKFPRGEWRLTGAYSELRDIILIGVGTSSPFVNASSGRLRSVELEGLHHIDTETTVRGSIAYTNTELSGSDGAIPGSSDWLGQLGIQHRFDSGMTADLELRHVAGFFRQAADPRPTSGGYDLANLTFSMRVTEGLTARAGVANLLDSRVRYPSFLAESPMGEVAVSYPEDLPRAGRTWWMLISQRF